MYFIGDYEPWYVGWSDCDPSTREILSKLYERPDFIPLDSEPGRRDWFFMGTPGHGAPFHIDQVEFPSWQAQVL